MISKSDSSSVHYAVKKNAIVYFSGCFVLTACVLLPSATFALEPNSGSKGEPQAKAGVTKTEIIKAIETAKILPPGIGLTVDLIKDQVAVSTYRHARASDDDCKKIGR